MSKDKSTPKSTRDWSAYNKSLVNRGDITLFVSKEFADSWYVKYDEDTKRSIGGQSKYTDNAIIALYSLKYVYKLALRTITGFAKSLVRIMGSEQDIPDYSTLSDRFKTLKIKLPHIPSGAAGHIASLDSTGLKIHGQGEWNRKKHSQRDRRQWVKMHLVIDNDSMQILGVESTADDVHDCEVFNDLVNKLPDNINKVLGDGAYGTIGAYKTSEEANIELIALPKSNDTVDKTSTEPHILKRNGNVGYHHEKGIYAWANKNSYWGRNRVESTMSRFVTSFGDRISSRTVQAQKNEIVIKCNLLNIMMANNGCPQDSAA